MERIYDIDTRFKNTKELIIPVLINWINMKYTTKDLQDILKCAEKLEIPDYCTRPSVDVLYEIAVKLAIFEKEVVQPDDIINRIREYLKSN